jgi:hypothetical protein
MLFRTLGTTLALTGAKPWRARHGASARAAKRNGSAMQDELDMLGTLGYTLPSPAYIAGAIVFGLAGLFAYYDGKRQGRPRERWLGLALMLYPYLIQATWLLYLVGLALCIGAWLDRRHA